MDHSLAFSRRQLRRRGRHGRGIFAAGRARLAGSRRVVWLEGPVPGRG